MKCITITTDGTWAEAELPSEDSMLSFLQSCVGGWVEAHTISHIGNVMLWMNEEGAIRDGFLPNPIASAIWSQEFGFGRIMGDVVLTSLSAEDGQTTGLTPQQLTKIKERYLHE